MQTFEQISFQSGGESRKKISVDKKAESVPIKVLIVAPTLDTSLGGQAVQAARLLEKLGEEANLTVGIQSIGPKFLPRLQRVKFLRTCLTLVKFWFDILVKIPKYDIIHIFSAAHLSFLLTPTPAVLVARLFGKKTVLNYHSGQFNRHYARWKRSLRPTLKLFDRIVVPSGYLVDMFAKQGFEARAIYNFVDVGRFPFRARERPRPVFLSNRLLEELYNIPCIVRAFAVIQKKYPDARLIVAGFGDRRESLETLSGRLNLRNVEFRGKIEPDEMPALYDEADVYLNSPNTDNMPVSIIESYACGIPIVTTNAGGIPYILKHDETGLMVGIDDHEAMAREAVRLLEEPELARRLTENARLYVDKFTWENARHGWLEVYEELAKEIVDK